MRRVRGWRIGEFTALGRRSVGGRWAAAVAVAGGRRRRAAAGRMVVWWVDRPELNSGE